MIEATAPVIRAGRHNPRLVKVESPLAGVTEIHLMDMQDSIMRMRAVDGVDVLPKQVVELKPGGYHVMLMMLKQPVGKVTKCR